jgi:hypothetical protein
MCPYSPSTCQQSCISSRTKRKKKRTTRILDIRRPVVRTFVVLCVTHRALFLLHCCCSRPMFPIPCTYAASRPNLKLGRAGTKQKRRRKRENDLSRLRQEITHSSFSAPQIITISFLSFLFFFFFFFRVEEYPVSQKSRILHV